LVDTVALRAVSEMMQLPAWHQWQDWAPAGLLRSRNPAATPRSTPRPITRLSPQEQAPGSMPLCFGAAASAIAGAADTGPSADAAAGSGCDDCCAQRQASTSSSVLLGLATERAASTAAVMAALAGTPEADLCGEYARTLLLACEQLANAQLSPKAGVKGYRGPIALLKEAYAASLECKSVCQKGVADPVAGSPGFPPLALAVLDNSSQIHGQPHPMVAMLSISGHQLLMLRRQARLGGKYEAIFRPPTSTNEGREAAEEALEWACATRCRQAVMESIDKASRVHCVSARPGDLVILADVSMLHMLTVDEVVNSCNEMLPPIYGPGFVSTPAEQLQEFADRLAGRCQSASDSAVLVAEVVESTTQPCPLTEECRACSLAEDCRPHNRTPVIEGSTDGFKLQCGIGIGDWQMSFYASVPTATPSPPKRPSRTAMDAWQRCTLPVECAEGPGSVRGTSSTAREKNRQPATSETSHSAAARSTRHSWLGA